MYEQFGNWRFLDAILGQMPTQILQMPTKIHQVYIVSYNSKLQWVVVMDKFSFSDYGKSKFRGLWNQQMM